ncbi:glycosyl transferase group 1 (plasmid) [Methanohalobium evestigatum Z-7303]|uniref:Glycosyl transferase group 1 n=1 Tax=Methanohalobium evestigatum (strain ATCC BAA-1072 / DSM 3721 / NBRC 107634 / OCM 161 / Z-7303) TaxID=644295 RepID=D7EBY1_METEZ|nr:glycosyltransferase [Methanohalobium evestigatum]ADI75103.1 glycosyl transferase group 1 [Methanohalobium evestigatum Z-7303]
MSKTIALFISSLENGGAEKVVSNLSINLPDKYKIKLMVYHTDQIDYQYNGEIIDLNISIPEPDKSLKNMFIRVFTFFSLIQKSKNIKKQYEPQATISFLTAPNILNLFSKLSDNVIISVHSQISQGLKGLEGKIHKQLIKLFYNHAYLIIAVSKGVKKDLVNNFRIKPEKIKVIHNPYETDKIQKLADYEIEQEYQDIFESPVIINVGRLVDVKGQNHLIKAFSKVKDEVDNAKLVFLGRGELENELKELAEKYRLENDIFFMGFQKNPFKFIKNSSVFVLSSTNEGFPNAIVESMACGIPIISTDCFSGPREILAPDTDINYQTNVVEYAPYGILTPVCNDGDRLSLKNEENMLSDAINQILKNDELKEKYGLLAQKRAEDFDIKNIIPQWETILD